LLERLEERCVLDHSSYTQTNLVSDLPGIARIQDPNLVNPWGLDAGPTSPWWVADNGTGLSTLYNGNTGQIVPLVVTIPPPAGSPAGTTSAPTGLVFNGTGDFSVAENAASGSAFFIFATEDGTISGWNPTVDLHNAVLAADNSGSGAVYKGLALGSSGGSNFLFATNFHAGTIDIFDANFQQVSLPAGALTDPHLPAGYAPFGIRNINGDLYVTYAKQDADKHDDVSGMGHGFVDVYDTSGNLLRRLITRGQLNSPWGLALAPATFGEFANDLLVGNFGNGRINAYDPNTGEFLGRLGLSPNHPISIDGLWSLSFGNNGLAGPSSTLFFTAGLNDEADGLFGSITVGPSTSGRSLRTASAQHTLAGSQLAVQIQAGKANPAPTIGEEPPTLSPSKVALATAPAPTASSSQFPGLPTFISSSGGAENRASVDWVFAHFGLDG
jgi:uncharacterized protein (TIGR03118 family)